MKEREKKQGRDAVKEQRRKVPAGGTAAKGFEGAPASVFNPVEGVHPDGDSVDASQGEQLFNPVEGTAPGRSAVVRNKATEGTKKKKD